MESYVGSYPLDIEQTVVAACLKGKAENFCEKSIRRWDSFDFSDADAVKRIQEKSSDIFSEMRHEIVKDESWFKKERREVKEFVLDIIFDSVLRGKIGESVKNILRLDENTIRSSLYTKQEKKEDAEREIPPNKIYSFVDFLQNVQSINNRDLRHRVMMVTLDIRKKSKKNLSKNADNIFSTPLSDILLCYKYGLRNFAGVSLPPLFKGAWGAISELEDLQKKRSVRNKIEIHKTKKDQRTSNFARRQSRPERRGDGQSTGPLSENKERRIRSVDGRRKRKVDRRGGQGALLKKKDTNDVLDLERDVSNLIIRHDFCADVSEGDLGSITILGNVILHRIGSLFDMNIEGDLYIEDAMGKIDIDTVDGNIHIKNAFDTVNVRIVTGTAVVENPRGLVKILEEKGVADVSS